jgi:glycosyltransferase involved in cell wall biosynthesis
MFLGKSVAVIVPAHQEQRLIQKTLVSIPPCVDRIYVVDDASSDATSERVRELDDPRIVLLRHAQNRGVGAAIVTGYAQALADGHDILAVMAADNQMHPDDLPPLLAAVANGCADYAKGNRFLHARAREMPWARRQVGQLLSWLTRLATRLHVSDTQCGFTALSALTARRLPLEQLWPRYGYPNDLLGWLARRGAVVRDIPVRPIYAGEKSGLRAVHVLIILGLIARTFVRCRLARAR